jgi:hypothetical protein
MGLYTFLNIHTLTLLHLPSQFEIEMTKQRKENVKLASVVDLRSVHTADTAPDNPQAHNMLEDEDIVGNITTSPCRSARLWINTNVTETLAEGLKHNRARSWQSELVNDRKGNTSRWVKIDDPDIIPIVESDLISARDSDGQKSESAFAKVEYEEEEPVPFNEEQGDDLEGSISDHSCRMRELKNNAWITAHRLQWVENQLKEECRMFHENVQTQTVKTSELQCSNQIRDYSPKKDGWSWQSELSDENIRQAVDNINNLTKCKEEMQSEYNAYLAAQVQIQKEEIYKAELKNHKHRLELEAEAKVLCQEEEEFEKKQKSLEKWCSWEHVEENSMASRDMNM